MRILWISNVKVQTDNITSSGGWLVSMAKALKEVPNFDLELFNFIPQFKIKRVQSIDNNQYHIPFYKNCSQKMFAEIVDLVNHINPDIIHLWGTENNWGEFFYNAKGIKAPILLDMQGVLSSCIPELSGGISKIQLMKHFGLLEILFFKDFFFKRSLLANKAVIESQIIKKADYISVQSQWVEIFVKTVNPKIKKLFNTGIILRDEFYNAPKWTLKDHQDKNFIFSIACMNSPLKGGHILLQAFAILKKKYSNLHLKIGGIYKSGIKQSAYHRYIKHIAKSLNIYDSIEWLGPLNAVEIINNMHASSVFVTPSFIESYSMTIAEACYIGIPCVATYAGALPEMSGNKRGVLYFPKGDYIMCAHQIEQIICNKDLAQQMSMDNISIAAIRNQKEAIVNRQIAIYQTLQHPEK